jgi:WD40 repeat protein
VEHESLSVRFDPVRPRLVRGGRSFLESIDLNTGRTTRSGGGRDPGRLHRVEFLPDGSGLFTHNAEVVARWDPEQLRPVPGLRQTVASPSGIELRALMVRPDGAEFLAVYGTRVGFYRPDTFAPTRPGWDAPDDPLDARYVPGGRVLLGLRNNSAVLADADTGRPVAPPMTHERAVTSVAASPDGAVLLTGSRDGTARFWDATTGLPLGPPLRHAGPVAAVAYSPAGDRVVTGTVTGFALTWKPPPAPLGGTLDEIRAATRDTPGP